MNLGKPLRLAVSMDKTPSELNSNDYSVQEFDSDESDEQSERSTS